jgi:hypothetical protein
MTILAEMILTLAIPLGLDRYLPVPEENWARRSESDPLAARKLIHLRA